MTRPQFATSLVPKKIILEVSSLEITPDDAELRHTPKV